MHSTVHVFHTGVCPSFIRANVLDPTWLNSIRQRHLLDICSASNKKLELSGSVAAHLRVGESCTRVSFGVISELVVPVLLGKTYFNWFIKSIYPANRKIVFSHSPPVPIFMVHETWNKTEIDKLDSHQGFARGLASSVKATTCEPKCIMVTQQVVLKAICETLLLVFTQAVRLIEVITFQRVSKHHACMTAKSIVYVYWGHPFYINIPNIGKEVLRTKKMVRLRARHNN